MVFLKLFQKFQEGVKVLAKSPTFAKDPRQFQFEADINRLFLYTSYNRVGTDAEEADIDEIIEMAGKASVEDQQRQVQENVHSQIKSFCSFMDEILIPDVSKSAKASSPESVSAHPRSGLSLAVGGTGQGRNHPDIPETRPLKLAEISQRMKDEFGYTLAVKQSLIPHKEAGRGLFLDGKADVGTVIALYPGVIYSPAYYRYIPGYPRVDANNPYLITRYDGTVINAQPWGLGGESREVWTGKNVPDIGKGGEPLQGNLNGSDRMWKLLSKPLEAPAQGKISDVLERRNPLALAHFANHPAKSIDPNVMICPFDFPMNESGMRPYIPNIQFGGGVEEQVRMKKFGSFWFKLGKRSNEGLNVPMMKSLVLVATRELCDEELLLNYRLSNSKRRPAWYTPVDEEEDRRRWS